jgi:hypothetical protein
LHAPAVEADTWTNQAGHALVATLVDYQPGWVTLHQEGRGELTMPLEVLTAENQRTIKLRYGTSITPPYVQAAYRDAQTLLARYQRLPIRDGSAEEQKKINRMALMLFDERIRTFDTKSLAPVEKKELARMRSALALGELDPPEKLNVVRNLPANPASTTADIVQERFDANSSSTDSGRTGGRRPDHIDR